MKHFQRRTQCLGSSARFLDTRHRLLANAVSFSVCSMPPILIHLAFKFNRPRRPLYDPRSAFSLVHACSVGSGVLTLQLCTSQSGAAFLTGRLWERPARGRGGRAGAAPETMPGSVAAEKLWAAAVPRHPRRGASSPRHLAILPLSPSQHSPLAQTILLLAVRSHPP